MSSAACRCPNCSAELTDEYCPRCGQHRIRPEDLSARRFLHELVDEIASLRQKSRTLRTLYMLLTPGLLTAEYLMGRRQSHLNPLKLYVVCASIFFLAAPLAGFRLASMLDADASGALSSLVSARAAERSLNRPLFDARFDVRAKSVYTITLGAAALVVALMLQWLFRKENRPYGAHLIFALHYISFMYLLTIATGVSRTMGLSLDAAESAGYALMVPYLVLALKRIYPEPTGMILSKAGALLLLTFTLNKMASLAAIRLTLELV